MSAEAAAPTPARPQLGIIDTTSIIVGIIIGVGIYRTPGLVFQSSAAAWQALALWLLGGVLCLVGALCYAELASSYPRSGGEYVYLSRAYGPGLGFVFGWAQLVIVRPAASIAPVAYVFADYTDRLFDLGAGPAARAGLAATAVLVLTGINMLGVPLGKRTQNLLTLLKVLGIVGLLLAGGWCWWAAPPPSAPSRPLSWPALGGALLAVLWTYGGWHEAAYVAAEVRQPQRNLPWAFLLGTGIVLLLYLLLNLAYLGSLGLARAAGAEVIAADVIQRALQCAGLERLHDWGARAMSLLIVLSALGSLNGTVFTSARIFAALGAEHALFAPLAHWHRRWGTPLRALVVHGGLAVTIILLSGLWPRTSEGTDAFQVLVEGTAAVLWLFFLLTALSVFVLRWRDARQKRTFTTPFYPLTPLLFCLLCLLMLLASVAAAPLETLLGLGITLLGWPLYWLSCRCRRQAAAPVRTSLTAGERSAEPPSLPG
jgi:APA family basic amino acid/polyamine antiporter